MKEPAWLTHAIDQRMALLEDKVSPTVSDVNLIMTPLFEPAEDTTAALDRWEHTCDNPSCGRYLPNKLHPGHAVRLLRNGTQVFMTFAVCSKCKTAFED